MSILYISQCRGASLLKTVTHFLGIQVSDHTGINDIKLTEDEVHYKFRWIFKQFPTNIKEIIEKNFAKIKSFQRNSWVILLKTKTLFLPRLDVLDRSRLSFKATLKPCLSINHLNVSYHFSIWKNAQRIINKTVFNRHNFFLIWWRD